LPGHDRPRERLLALGSRVLSERELLAILLRAGRKGQNAIELAGELIAEFGGLAELSVARPEELGRLHGIGPVKAATLAAAFRLGQLAADAPRARERLRGPEDVARVAARELRGARREQVIVLVCDAGNRLLRTVPVGEGAVDRSLFPVREILNAVLRHDGLGFAVAHNHPSGDPTPSRCDTASTADLAAAAKVVGLRLIDHVVVADDQWRRATDHR
jgi:DNA repair protein RadC